VSRVPNAYEFLRRFRKACDDYNRLFEPRIAKVRAEYAKSPVGKPPPSVDESLEAHIRVYVVNALLAALNWRLDAKPEDGLPNLIPEAPIASEEKGTTRFLDYLGFERQTNSPLLIVETKRPSSVLPQPMTPFDSSSDPEIISRGLAGEPLMGQWSEWLASLRDYARSVHAKARQTPRRVVLTNGKWLVLFLEPDDAFVKEPPPKPNRILVFPYRSDIEQSDIELRYTELFRHLEYGIVSREMSGLTPGELPLHVARDAIDRIMHGLRLRYIEQPGIYQPSPVIKVAPVIFLRSRYGTWLRVETPPGDYEVPHQPGRILQHLTKVQKAATDLLCQTNNALGTRLQPSPLAKHYENEESFDLVRGIVECSEDEFLVVTGDKTHYLLPESSVPQCLHHDWGQSNIAGVACNPGPIMGRSIEPRAFFISSEVHHCAHRDVAAAKASQITAENRMRCGARSGQDGQAFCEIWRFESHLCCRTCAFEEVCTKAEVFHLPCQHPKPKKAGSSLKPARLP
jgi:hypothetical protein